LFDSVSGNHLLIPQGARLIGTYDSATAYGDRRLLLVWNRLVFPNGWSINLEGMQGADPSGTSGVRDRTDNHLDRLAGAIGLAAIISVVANESEDDDDQSFSRSVGDAAAQEAARSGGRIVDRELSVRPTLRVRIGAPVRVLVTRDIRLRPYHG
jgi:type IV secretory pathway VirB10-like protein